MPRARRRRRDTGHAAHTAIRRAIHTVGLVVTAGLTVSIGACGSSNDVTTPPTTGTIVVTVSGLPGGLPADIVVTGDQGFSRTVPETATLGNVPPGLYRITLRPVGNTGAPWYPDADSTTIVVEVGSSTVRHFYYGTLPMSGAYVPELAVFDSLMIAYMGTRHITAGTFAISRNGTHLMERGYGWLDASRAHPVTPDTPFRLASLSKPLTYAAVENLVAQGALSPSAPVYPLLGIQPLPGVTPDPRLDSVTVQNVLDHKGGWDDGPGQDSDWVFQSRLVAQQMGLSAPPTKQQLAQYMMGRPLQHEPGTVYAYSNFGYSLLGMVIEKVTGENYAQYVLDAILRPIGATDIFPGATLPQYRNAREPRYLDPYDGCSVFDIPTCAPVPWPDGGFYLEAFDSFGGWVASAPAYLTFLDNYCMMGPPREPNYYWDYTFYGSLPGTFTMARERTDGINMVVLFDQRTDSSGLPYDPQTAFDAVASAIRTWPLAGSRISRRSPPGGS